MSYDVGTLTRDAQSGIIAGRLNVFDMFKGNVRLRTLEEQERSYSTKAPHFDVIAGSGEDAYKLGSVWRNKAKEAGKSDVYSMTLDHPTWEKPLSLVGFVNKNDCSQIDVKWQR